MKKFLIFSLVMITAICFSTVYGQSEETSLSPVVTELIGLTPEQELEVYEIMSRGPNGHWCGESVDLGVGKGELCWYRENYNFQATFKPLVFYNGVVKARACSRNTQDGSLTCGGWVRIEDTSRTEWLYEGPGNIYSPRWQGSY